jgi:anti-sigma factor RsiW
MWCQVCCDEILEEVGYGLQPHQLLPISSVVSSAGITGSQQAMFFAHVRYCPGYMLRDWQAHDCTHWVCASAGPAVVDSLAA